MDSINTIQALIGEELTEDWVHLLVKAPFEHLLELLNALSPIYYDWLENEISQVEPHEGTKTTHYCIDPYPREIPWNQWAEKYKQLLLYYPSIAIPDPLAQTLHPFITLAHLFKRLGFGGFPVDEADLRQRLNDSMSVLVQLRPFLQDRSIILQPSPFVIDYEIVQSAADKDLTSMQGEMKERYYEKLYDIAESDYATSRDAVENVVGAVKVWGKVCALLDYMPVAANGLIREVLEREYGVGMMPRSVPRAEQRITQALMQFDVPGTSKISFSDVLSLRKNEDAFYEWRIAFRQVIDMAQKESPKDQQAFNAEVRLAAETIMTPLTEQLKTKVKSSSALEKMLIPSALSVSAGLIAFSGFGASFPIAALVGAGLSPAGWVAEKLIKRFNKSGRKAIMVREFYSHLLEK